MPVALHDRGTVAARRPRPRRSARCVPSNSRSVVRDAAARLREAVGRHRRGRRARPPLRETRVELRPPDQQDPEPRQVGAAPRPAGGAWSERARRARPPGRRASGRPGSRPDTVEHGHRRARTPRVASARASRRCARGRGNTPMARTARARGRPHHRAPRTSAPAPPRSPRGTAPTSFGSPPVPDVAITSPTRPGSVRNGVGEQHLVVGGDDRRGTRQVHDRPPISIGQTRVERQDGRALRPEIRDHVQPGGARRKVDRDQEARCGAQVPAHVR